MKLVYPINPRRLVYVRRLTNIVCPIVVTILLGACQLLPAEVPLSSTDSLESGRDALQVAPQVQILTERLLGRDEQCAGHFIPYDLDHMTMAPGGETISMFEANGGGVAINDLDGDGWQEIVLANHRDPNTILWNHGLDQDGSLHFETERIGQGDSRAVATVDVDGDGWLDIVFSRRVSAPNYWRNLGNRQFEQTTLPGVAKPLYAISWADLDIDGDMDLVGGTYDAALLAEFGHEFLNGTNAGVFVYLQDGGVFHEQPLALNAQALALVLVDIDGDQRPDILVGNDFGVPDYGWLNLPASDQSEGVANLHPINWEALSISLMSHSTMSYAAGDLNNDGRLEVFTTDMMPYADDQETIDAWAPVMLAMVDEEHDEDDPQIMANVLRSSTALVGREQMADRALGLGIHASGWSWSGKFGDLNQDGLLDLYIVNGMIESTTFSHLPDHELREENQAFRNVNGEQYVPMPEWRLNTTASGRGMSMADLDNDGDLDIVVNNLREPAIYFENQLCEGRGVTVDLEWLGSANTGAVGSVAMLYTTSGTYRRQVEVASGYLSGDSSQLHFGIADNVEPERLVILWPDGLSSETTSVLPSHRLKVVRSSGGN